ncbi:uncharacterized protein [Heliangelus exortis]|uniref:uncharacterized protein isoform X2 n=1 Tax=Heliangelus exortis TaxID=472823 RepID=UPI003A90B64F
MFLPTATMDAAAAAAATQPLPGPGGASAGEEPRVTASRGRIPRASASGAVGISVPGACGAVRDPPGVGREAAVEQRGTVPEPQGRWQQHQEAQELLGSQVHGFLGALGAGAAG